MPKPRTPTAILEAKGAFKKDPQRRREGEPIVTTPLGPPPDYLTEDARAAWMELAEGAPMGVLTSADRGSVELAAVLLADFRYSRKWLAEFEDVATSDDLTEDTAERLIATVKRLKGTFPAAHLAQLIKLLGQFGMTPSERSRLSIKPPEDHGNRFAGIGQKSGS